MAQVLVPISIGELIDKITILEIKSERLNGRACDYARHELLLLRRELGALQVVIDPIIMEDLRQVNKALWDIEDAIRDHERRQDFDGNFIQLARSVYINNDRRAAVKREINNRTGSEIVEVKSYQSYSSDQ